MEQNPVNFLLAQARRQWQHLVSINCKKQDAMVSGATDLIEGLNAAAVKVDADLADTEMKLKKAEYAEAHGTDWREQSWAKKTPST